MNTHAPIDPGRLLKQGPVLLFATMMLGHFAQGLTFTAFAPALPQLAHYFGGGSQGELVAQLTLTISALGMMVGALASGWIVDRLGYRTVLLGALLCYGALGSGGLVLQSATALLASRFGVGFAGACLVTTCVSLIAARYEGDRRARVLGISGAMASGISLVAMLIGGSLARYGGWRLPFIQFPIFAAAGLLIVFGAPRVAPLHRGQERAAAGKGFFNRLWPMYILATVLAAVMFMGSTQFSFMLAQDGVNDPALRSVIMSTITLVAVLVSLVYGSVQGRLGLLGAMVVGVLTMSAALFVVDLTSSPLLAAAAAVLMGVFVGITLPFMHHFVTERASLEERSRAIGVLNAFNFLGGFANPLVFVPLARIWGLRAVFLMAAGLMLAIGVAVLVWILTQRGRPALRISAH
jgi:MFS family permease